MYRIQCLLRAALASHSHPGAATAQGGEQKDSPCRLSVGSYSCALPHPHTWKGAPAHVPIAALSGAAHQGRWNGLDVGLQIQLGVQ